jgi:hypothetical protein
MSSVILNTTDKRYKQLRSVQNWNNIFPETTWQPVDTAAATFPTFILQIATFYEKCRRVPKTAKIIPAFKKKVIFIISLKQNRTTKGKTVSSQRDPSRDSGHHIY